MISYLEVKILYVNLLQNEMKKEFEMSMFGDINFFMGLQVHKMKHGI